MNTEKDYSLLRPFDLEAAKAGEAICWHEDGDVAINVYFVKECVIPVFEECFEDEQCGIFNYQQCNECLRMAPLCWVEGKPVYKGDVLYSTGGCHTGEYVAPNGKELIRTDLGEYLPVGDDCGSENCRIDYLTWTPPKVKREGWVNIIEYNRSATCGEIQDRMVRNCHIFPDFESATKWAAQCHDVIATVRIEWEEPAGGAA